MFFCPLLQSEKKPLGSRPLFYMPKARIVSGISSHNVNPLQAQIFHIRFLLFSTLHFPKHFSSSISFCSQMVFYFLKGHLYIIHIYNSLHSKVKHIYTNAFYQFIINVHCDRACSILSLPRIAVFSPPAYFSRFLLICTHPCH